MSHKGMPDAGFNILCSYRKHKTSVHEVAYIAEKDAFASVDDLAIHLWHSTSKRPNKMDTLKDIHFPSGRGRFVTAMTFSSHARSLFCACLDGCLRIYKHNLKMRACLQWPESIVHAMVYVPKRDELLIAGAAGVKERYPCTVVKTALTKIPSEWA
jgi:WD40 repeat protein